MAGITVRHRGDFSKLEKFLNRVTKHDYLNILERYGKIGVDALSSATPKRSGLTASSWTYEIEHNRDTIIIRWLNTNENKGVNIALILEYGHGTRRGGYVRGRKYISPAIQPIFDKMADEVWREVTE